MIHTTPKQSDKMDRPEILDKAKECVTRDREATHGVPEESFTKLAKVWSAMVGVEITAAQTCLMLTQLKAVRAWGNPGHADNWVDGAGYFSCGGELGTAHKAEPVMGVKACGCFAPWGSVNYPCHHVFYGQGGAT